MTPHTPEPSLNATAPAQPGISGDRIRNAEAAVHLLAQEVVQNRSRIEELREALRREVEKRTSHEMAEKAAERIMARAAQSALAAGDSGGWPVPERAKPKRDRHGLRVIPGGLAAALPLAAGWFAARGARRAVLTALSLAAGGGLVLGSGMMDPSQQAPALVHPHVHVRGAAPGTAQPFPAAAPGPSGSAAAGTVGRRHCRDRDGDGDAFMVLLSDGRRACRERDQVPDAAAGKPAAKAHQPVPVPPAPAPVPVPSVTGSPVPVLPSPAPDPSPSCVLAGKSHHCRDGLPDVVPTVLPSPAVRL